MDYKRIHDNIIERGKTRIVEGYTEKHHIVPKCLGGDNAKSNLVKLSAREHFIIHKLLCFIYPNNVSLKRAYWLMANRVESSLQNRKYKISSREYNYIRKEFSKINSETKKGNTYTLGYKHTNEAKKKMTDKLFSEETRKKMSIAAKKRGANNIGHVKSKETLRKMSENSSKSKKVIHIESGVVYRSMTEASKQCGIAHRNIFNHCNNLVKNPKFKHID